MQHEIERKIYFSTPLTDQQYLSTGVTVNIHTPF